MTLNELKAQVTKYAGKTAFTDLVFTVSGTEVDALLQAINNAKRHIQYLHDFEACRCIGKLSFASTSSPDPVIYLGDLADIEIVPEVAVVSWDAVAQVFSTVTANLIEVTDLDTTLNNGDIIRISGDTDQLFTVTGGPYAPNGFVQVSIVETVTGSPEGNLELRITEVDPITIKLIEAAYLSDSFTPIDFLSREQYMQRVRAFIGRDHTAVYTPDFPSIIQHGLSLYLQEAETDVSSASEFYFDVVRLLPDYHATDHPTDWFLEQAPEALLWQSVLELNSLTKEYVPTEEGNLDEPFQKAQAAIQAAINRDAAYRKHIAPRQPAAYPQPQPPKKK